MPLMEMQITLKDVFTLLIGVGLVILVYYLVSMVRNTIPAVKSLSKIMKDAEVISGVAAEGAQEVHHVIEGVSESVSSITDLIRGNQSYVAAATNIVNAMAALRNLTMKKSEDETDKE